MKRLCRKALHLCGAVICSVIGLYIGIVLIAVGYLATVVIPIDNGNQMLSLFLGIVGSVVASIIYSISDKYAKSLGAFSWLLNQVELFIKAVEFILNDDSLNNGQSKFELWCLYNSIRERSCELTYRKEFDKLSEKMDKMIGLLNTDDINLLKKEKCSLVSIRNELTE